MSFRAIASIASIFLGLLVTAASAQQPALSTGVRLPACSQSMIVGTTWHVFMFGIYYNTTPSGFSCPLSIAANGTVTSGTCLSPPSSSTSFTLSQPPTGMLTIDRSCHVTGTVNFSFLDPNSFGLLPVSMQLKMTLWRSADGSRLSGSAFLSGIDFSDGKAGPVSVVVPVDFIAQ
jgi:hypothetical protein